MHLDQLLVANGQQAVAVEVVNEVGIDGVLVEVLSLDEKLCIVRYVPYYGR